MLVYHMQGWRECETDEQWYQSLLSWPLIWQFHLQRPAVWRVWGHYSLLGRQHRRLGKSTSYVWNWWVCVRVQYCVISVFLRVDDHYHIASGNLFVWHHSTTLPGDSGSRCGRWRCVDDQFLHRCLCRYLLLLFLLCTQVWWDVSLGYLLT